MNNYIGIRTKIIMNIKDTFYNPATIRAELENFLECIKEDLGSSWDSFVYYLEMMFEKNQFLLEAVSFTFLTNERLLDSIKALCRTAVFKGYFKNLYGETNALFAYKTFQNGVRKLSEDAIMLINSERYEDNLIDNFSILLKVAEGFMEIFEGMEEDLRKRRRDEWEKVLLNVCKPDSASVSKAHLIVSVSRDCISMIETNYDIISCSYLDGVNCKKVFKDRDFGWIFNPDREQIIGMSPMDVGCVVIKVESDMKAFCAALVGKHFVSRNILLCLNTSKFIPYWGVKELSEETDGYNELLLRGDTRPTGIFVRKRRLEQCAPHVITVAMLKRLPIVIYDDETGSVEIKHFNDEVWEKIDASDFLK